ncbi:MAG: thiolase family protein [Candidatus Tectomicrobia bacterium]
MTIRGKAAIVGLGEVPTRRSYPDRTTLGLCAEAARMAIEDAGLRKADINGLVTDGGTAPAAMAEYINLRPTFATGVAMQGASGTSAMAVAASAVLAGYCDTAMVVMGSSRRDRARAGAPPNPVRAEWEIPYGMAAGANTGYGLMYVRHMHEYGTKPEQMAKMAADQRFNALKNPNAVFQNQPITIDDVLNSRYISYPLRLLESVMPCDGAAACIVTTPERARALPHRPVYLLGVGMEQGAANVWQTPRITTTPVKVSAARAFQMAGYGPKDIQFAEFYD